jgi:uncharacterized repeat protein (TIGR01451 family)
MKKKFEESLSILLLIGMLVAIGLLPGKPAKSDNSTVGNTYYVNDSGGNDSNPGTLAAPLKTIQQAANFVHAGDTVHVAPGEYDEVIVTKVSGTVSARIQFISDTAWGAKIRSTGSQYTWTNNGDYVDIQGFDISTSDDTTRVGIMNFASHVRIVGNLVHDIPALNAGGNGVAGIDAGNYSGSDTEIIGNVVHDIGNPAIPTPTVHGIYISNYADQVVNNISYRNQGWGIHSWHAATNATIANNLVFENGHGGIIVGAGDAPGGVTADYFLVTNNIAVNNKSYGVIEIGIVGTHNQYLNNLVYGNQSGGFSLQHGTMAQNTVVADPLFVNYQADGTGDYHLAAGSPAIDAGTSLGAPATDLDGVARPQGRGFDIGPYEYVTSVETGPIITKTVDKSSVSSGETLTYTINYSNPTANAYPNTKIEDLIPNGTTYVDNSATGGATFDGSKIILNIGNLAAGASGNIQFQVRVE